MHEFEVCGRIALAGERDGTFGWWGAREGEMAGCDEPALGPKGIWKDKVPGVAMEDVWGSEDDCSRG